MSEELALVPRSRRSKAYEACNMNNYETAAVERVIKRMCSQTEVGELIDEIEPFLSIFKCESISNFRLKEEMRSEIQCESFDVTRSRKPTT